MYVAPEQTQSTNYYTPYSTLSYQSSNNKPTIMDQLYKSKYSDNHYYSQEEYQHRQEYRQPKESYQGFMNRANKNLEHEFKCLTDKLNNMRVSRIDEQEIFSNLIYEIKSSLDEIDTFRDKISYLNIDNFNDQGIDKFQLLEFLHSQQQEQIRLCDIELFYGQIIPNNALLTKTKLNNLLGNKRNIQSIDNQEENQFSIARLITMILQSYILFEIKRQQFVKQGIRFDELFHWIDMDQDGIITLMNFTTKFKGCGTVFKWLTSGSSLDLNNFIQIFKPQSRATYF